MLDEYPYLCLLPHRYPVLIFDFQNSKMLACAHGSVAWNRRLIEGSKLRSKSPHSALLAAYSAAVAVRVGADCLDVLATPATSAAAANAISVERLFAMGVGDGIDAGPVRVASVSPPFFGSETLIPPFFSCKNSI